MRVLVIEDKKMHQDSARETLVGHEVTIVGSYDQAIEAMNKKYNETKIEQFMRAAGFDYVPYEGCPQEYRSAYYKLYYGEVREQALLPFYDAVLTDMNMPMCKMSLTAEHFDPSEQVPYGFVLALLAAHRGAKFVAMVTDTNHHKGAMSAALDRLSPSYYSWHHDSKEGEDKPKVFNINGARVVFVHTPFVKKVQKDAPCDWCQGTAVCYLCKGTGDHQGSKCSCVTDYNHPGVCKFCHGTLKYDREYETTSKDWEKVLTDLTA